MTADPAQEFQKVFVALQDYGLLLVSDRAFSSVSGLIARAPIKGSWWSHPLGRTIFGVNEILEENKDVLITKLVDRKVTFVHRTMWAFVYAVATANERWQTDGLTTAAKDLLKRLQNKQRIDTSKIDERPGLKRGDLTRELEQRLLVHTQQIHTESGAHGKIIQTWSSWADRMELKDRQLESESAKQSLEKRVAELNLKFGAKTRLPWQF